MIPGVAAYGALEARRWAEDAAEAAPTVSCCCHRIQLPSRRAAVVDHYAEVAKVGLPIVAYNNPIDTKVDLTPALLARLHGEGLIVAIKEFSGDPRRGYDDRASSPRSSTC